MECVRTRMEFSTLLPVLPAYIQSHKQKGMSMARVVIQVFLNIHSLVLILFHTIAKIHPQSFMKYKASVSFFPAPLPALVQISLSL